MDAEDIFEINNVLNEAIAKCVNSAFCYKTKKDVGYKTITEIHFEWNRKRRVFEFVVPPYNFSGMSNGIGLGYYLWTQRHGKVWQADIEKHVKLEIGDDLPALSQHILNRALKKTIG